MKTLALLVCLAALLSFPAAAAADNVWNPNTVSENDLGSLGWGIGDPGQSPQMSSSGRVPASGAFQWFDITGWDSSSINWDQWTNPNTGTIFDNAREQVMANKRAEVKLETQLSHNSNLSQLLWRNTCRSAGEPGVSFKTYGGRQGCNWSGSGSAFPFFNEMHTASPTDGQAMTLGAPVAWNIEIWREGTAAPIFQRRIGIDGGDADPRGSTHTDWWLGAPAAVAANGLSPSEISSLLAQDYDAPSKGGLASSGRRSAGPLTAPISPQEYTYCNARFQNAPKSFSGVHDVNNGPKRYSYANGARKGSKLSKGTCYFHIPTKAGSRNSGEALLLQWNMSGAMGGRAGMGEVGVTLQGKPGFFYIIQATVIDSREQLLMPTDGPFADASGQNFLKVYMANGSRVPSGCSPPDPTYPKGNRCNPFTPKPQCSPPDDRYPLGHECNPYTPPTLRPGFDEPKPNVTLDGENAAPTRVETRQDVIVSDPGLEEGQALFPISNRLTHFTPQGRYNGAEGGSVYGYDYVSYGDDNPQHLPAGVAGPAGMQLSVLSQPAQLTPAADALRLAANNFGIAWLRPTLENPCPIEIQSLSPLTQQRSGVWPTDIARCGDLQGKAFRNAWDDYLEASSVYEARWVDESSSDDRPAAWINSQWLRCNGVIGNPAVAVASGCDQWNPITSYSGSARDQDGTALSSNRRVQGYLYAKPTKAAEDKGRDAQVGIVLDARQNRDNPGRLGFQWNAPAQQIEPLTLVTSDLRVWRRDSNGIVADSVLLENRTLQNSLSGKPELWFCTGGLPATASVDRGSISAADDLTALELENGAAPSARVGRLRNAADGQLRPDRAASAQDMFPAKDHTTNDQEGCAGYQVEWNWEQPSASWDESWDGCGYNTLAPRGLSFLRPNDLTSSLADDWGRYSDGALYERRTNQAGVIGYSRISNAYDFRPLFGNYPGAAPYHGKRPGRVTGANADGSRYQQQPCSKTMPGRWVKGAWASAGSKSVFDHWQPQPDLVVKTQTAPATKHWHKTGGGPKGKRAWWHMHPATFKTTRTPQPNKAINRTVNLHAWNWTTNKIVGCEPSENTPGVAKGDGRPYYNHLVKGIGDTNYVENAAVRANPRSNEVVGSYLDSWSCSRSFGVGTSFAQRGEWKVGGGQGAGPGPGWGKNQTAPNLPEGGYTTEFTFAHPSLRNFSIDWSLQGRYSGNAGWNWLSVTKASKIEDNPLAAAQVAAYGTRATR